MAKKYFVKEIFYTLQGEGFHSGRPAVFCRFSGCNLWTGREEDRSNAKCNFCDTDFLGTNGKNGAIFSDAKSLASKINSLWSQSYQHNKFVVLTGGEPLLQLDQTLIRELKNLNFFIAVESNGTIEAPSGIDWLTVSPKPNSQLKLLSGDELKLVFPTECHPENYSNLNFKHFFLSPLDERSAEKNSVNLDQALGYCLANPKWNLTMQHHKLWKIP